MNKSIVIALAAVVVIASGGFLILNKSSDKKSSTSTSTSSSNNNSSSSTDQSKTEPNTITFDGKGFSPSSLTVKSGDMVTIKNTSDSSIQFASDPHPTHTDDPDLNAGLVGAGKTTTFKVTKMGNFGYHNHFTPSEKGSITIN